MSDTASRPAYHRTVSGPITFADVARCSPPPGWTTAKQAAHERAWQTAGAQKKQETLTSAEEWRRRFGRTK